MNSELFKLGEEIRQHRVRANDYLNKTTGKVTQHSCTNPEWSVTCYPDHAFPKAPGYHMHRTLHDDALSPAEVRELAGEAVMQELRDLANFITWGK